uniref:Prothymosin alpha n=1 Tax=Urocitellus parryii TaxID=9999 RepID=A0A8D2IKB2_UROPR
MSDAAVDTSSEITTKDLKEKKEVVEEAENGRDAPRFSCSGTHRMLRASQSGARWSWDGKQNPL